MTQKQIADRLGIKDSSTISQWERGINSPYGRDLVKISKLFNVSSDHLLGIEGNEEEFSFYNFIPTAISAGLPIHVDGVTNDDIGKISIPDNLMGNQAGNKDISFTKIYGDSMNRVMPDGSLIAVKPISSLDDLKSGDIVVYAKGGEYAVKR